MKQFISINSEKYLSIKVKYSLRYDSDVIYSKKLYPAIVIRPTEMYHRFLFQIL